MIKITNRHLIGSSLIICQLSFTASLVSCSDWDDHYEEAASQAGAESTLWQTMQQHPELSDFREVLSKTMVMRQHHKTGVSYAQLLDGAQTFTVMAPVNGTFNKDSLLQLLQSDRGDSMVVRSFVGNHLSYGLANNTATPTEFFLLNSKRATIGQGQVLGVPMQPGGDNVSARGGVLHIMQRTLPYRHNLYEILLNDERYQQVGQLISSYDFDEFSPTLSVEGGMVEGQQVYVDSVFVERNRLLEAAGAIAAEDSSFIMAVPTAAEWSSVYNEALSYFRFDDTVEGCDSLQRFYALEGLLSHAIFSRTIQQSAEDSLKTYSYNKKYPQYEVYHRPFDQGGILYGAEKTDYSNGTLYTTPQWPFDVLKTFHKEIKAEGERTGLITDFSAATFTTRRNTVDTLAVSENEYLVITPEKNTSNWTMTFRLANTLSGAYDICAIVLPPTTYDPSVRVRPCKFQAEVNYVDTLGKTKTYNCENTKFTNDPERVDTVVLAENFVFPACNLYQNNIKVTLKLKCNITARETSQYSREMFLDCIYLRPKKTPTTE